MRFPHDQERQPEAVVETLVSSGVLGPVADRDDDAGLWTDCDLCSFVQNRCDIVLSPETLTDDERERWRTRAMSKDERLCDPRRHSDYLAPFWLLDQGRPVGTVALELSAHRQYVPAHSLFVFPDRRARGIAYRALRSIDAACRLGGFEGVLIDTHWSWQANVRRYLRRYGMWARSFKRSLEFVWADLPPHVIDVGEHEASIAIERGGEVVALITSMRLGERLGWVEHAAMVDDEVGRSVAFEARPTLAVALALEGWPLLRSADKLVAARGGDIGGPEVLAHKIALFEWSDRKQGFAIQTPRIPGLPYAEIERELEV
jgi:hypothetical protein